MLLDAEAHKYAHGFIAADESRRHWIGVSNFRTNRALVYAIEAARNLCGAQNDVALDLLKPKAQQQAAAHAG